MDVAMVTIRVSVLAVGLGCFTGGGATLGYLLGHLVARWWFRRQAARDADYIRAAVRRLILLLPPEVKKDRRLIEPLMDLELTLSKVSDRSLPATRPRSNG